MRALSLLAPALALVSAGDNEPLEFTQEDCESGEFADVIEITANVPMSFGAGLIFLTGDGSSGGSISVKPFVGSDNELLDDLNIGTYPYLNDAAFITTEGGPRDGDAARTGYAIVAPGFTRFSEGELGGQAIDCNSKEADCIPPSNGYQTILKAPVCFTDSSKGAACVDVESSYFITGVTPPGSGEPSSGTNFEDFLDFARFRSTGCRSIEVYLESEEGEDGGDDDDGDDDDDNLSDNKNDGFADDDGSSSSEAAEEESSSPPPPSLPPPSQPPAGR